MSRFIIPTSPLDLVGAKRRFDKLLKGGEAMACGCPRGTQFHPLACFLNSPPGKDWDPTGTD